jgi:D-amino-acid dehydrogenase
MNGAVLFEQDALFDPEAFMRSMIADLKGRGVDFFTETEVGEIESDGGSIRSVDADGDRFTADHFVLAAGAWSPRLGNQLGLRLPIEPATGYSITVDNPSTSLQLPLIVTDQKVTVTPMKGRLRIGGTLTLVGFDRTVDRRRVKPLERQALLYAPEYGTGNRALPEPRSGFRPCTTDGLPVIGRPAAWKNLVVAAGHGMLGMTEGPVTGRIVAELCMGREPSFDLAAVSPDRF